MAPIANRPIKPVWRGFAASLVALSLTASPALGQVGQPGFAGFGPPVFYPVGNAPSAVVLADLNGDGVPDAAMATSGQVSLLFGRGDGTFAPDQPVLLSSGLADLVAEDLDSDGDLDLAVVDAVHDRVWILLNDGEGVFTVSGSQPVGAQPQSLAAGDLDGDGDIDLVAANVFSTSVSVLFNQGGGVFSPQTTYTVGSWPVDMALSDLDGDGDGDNDLFVGLPGVVSVFENVGAAQFAHRPALFVGEVQALTLADIDADGALDLSAAIASTSSAGFDGVFIQFGVPRQLFTTPADIIANGVVDGFDLRAPFKMNSPAW